MAAPAETQEGNGLGEGEASTEVSNAIDPDPFIGRVLSHYRLEERLGAGGMGVLYRATDLTLGRLIAVKLLSRQLATDQTAKTRFLREARAASALDHLNIGAIHDICEQDGELFIVMALYEGETLKQRLEKGPLAVPEAVDVLRQVALGLEAAHRAGIVHRDIKPANVLVTRNGTVKILDFGLAKLVSDSQAQTMTQAGQTMGTLLYMSPEQLRGQSVDERSDLWSLGVLAHEALTGVSPFQAESSAATAIRILNDEPPPLTSVPGVPGWLAELVAQLLRKVPAERPQNANEVLQRLECAAPTGRPKRQPRLGLRGWATPRSRRWAAFGIGVLAIGIAFPASLYLLRGSLGAIDSVAVLPFANTGSDRDTEYLSDGIAESVINTLSRLPNLRVIPRSTVFRYKGKDLDPQTVGRDLGVRAVLSGRVQQRGDTLIVQTELVDVGKGSQLWGEQYNRKLADILATQDDIAREITDKLRLHLTREQERRLAKRYTENPDAYQLYLKGLYYLKQFTKEGLERGAQYFQQAIAVDPNYALAYSGLAYNYTVAEDWLVPPREVMPKHKEAAQKALELDDSLADAHAQLAYYSFWYDYNPSPAEREFKRAIELNPNDPETHGLYGWYLVAMKRFDEGIRENELGRKLDPFSGEANGLLGQSLYFARQYDRAIEQLRTTIELLGNQWWLHELLGWAYEAKALLPQAIAEFQKARQIEPNIAEPLASLGRAYALSGRVEEARRVLAQLQELSDRIHVPPYNIATIYAALGEKDRAIAELEKAYQERSWYLVWLGLDPQLDNLRSDPRFQDLVRRVGLPQ